MKRSFILVVVFFALASALFAQNEPLAPVLPEIAALRGPYLRNVAALRTARDARAGTITRAYVGNVERMQRDYTARGNLEAALLAKAEQERASGGQDPSGDERKAMPAALAQARQRYEQEREPIFAASRGQEAEQTRLYLTALQGLQTRLTTQNQLESALAVKTERERLTGFETGGAGVAGAPVAQLPRTIGTSARLDPDMADKIAAAVKAKSYVQTDSSDGTGGGKDIPETGALLIGFEFAGDSSDGVADIRSLRPIFLTREGIVYGVDRGALPKVTDKVEARNGYAVGGIVIGHNKRRIAGIQVIFMKIDMRTGKLDATNVNSYKSKWFGTRPRDSKTFTGGGKPVIGVWGQTGADADSLGLITMP